MPELPEVETVANALRPHLVGRRICDVRTWAPMLRTPLTLASSPLWRQARIIAVRRRAKYILVDLEEEALLLIHLGMTGSCRMIPADEPPALHDHVSVAFDNGICLRFRDPRRFGRFEIHGTGPGDSLPPGMATLGPEPFSPEFNAVAMQKAATGRSAPAKAFLMDNHRVVGVGNIYASEALFRAGISPHRPVGSLSRAAWQKLVEAVRSILSEAIAAGGTTIVDFQSVDGSEGLFEQQLAVYGRTELPCVQCGSGTIRLSRIAGRSTYHCPKCQR